MSAMHAESRTTMKTSSGRTLKSHAPATGELLGEVPIEMAIRETSDSGAPVVVSAPESSAAAVYRSIAAKVAESLKAAAPTTGPAIVFE